MKTLSIIVIAKNEERNIKRCLEGVHWADQIIVVDSASTDNTVALAKQQGATVLRREWTGYADQKEYALQQTKSEWILSLDADEVVSTELAEEIRGILAEHSAEFDGYRIPRKSHFLGRWMQYGGWYPGYQLRLFKKTRVFMNKRPVHEGFEVEGPVGYLKNSLDHYTYVSLHHYLDKMNEYTSLEVTNKLQKIGPAAVSWTAFLFHPLGVFARMYFGLRGWRDGMHGFLLAVYSSIYTLLVYAKTWEYQRALGAKDKLPPTTTVELQALQR